MSTTLERIRKMNERAGRLARVSQTLHKTAALLEHHEHPEQTPVAIRASLMAVEAAQLRLDAAQLAADALTKAEPFMQAQYKGEGAMAKWLRAQFKRKPNIDWKTAWETLLGKPPKGFEVVEKDAFIRLIQVDGKRWKRESFRVEFYRVKRRIL